MTFTPQIITDHVKFFLFYNSWNTADPKWSEFYYHFFENHNRRIEYLLEKMIESLIELEKDKIYVLPGYTRDDQRSLYNPYLTANLLPKQYLDNLNILLAQGIITRNIMLFILDKVAANCERDKQYEWFMTMRYNLIKDGHIIASRRSDLIDFD
jgi:hypothetical protein